MCWSSSSAESPANAAWWSWLRRPALAARTAVGQAARVVAMTGTVTRHLLPGIAQVLRDI